MTSRRFTLANIPRWAGLAALLMVLAPNTVFATHFELLRLASQIELISDQLADDLRYTRHYGSVRQRAVTLRREAAQLADSLRRNRSNSRIRSRFKDVRRGYERLEQAFFTADRRDHIPNLYREINLLSNVFISLSDQLYYAGIDGQGYGTVYNAPYSGLTIIGSRNNGFRNNGFRDYGPRNQGSRGAGSRHPGSRQTGNRDYGSRAGGLITPSRERAIPDVFRGNNNRIDSGRQGREIDRGAQVGRDKPGRAGLDRGSRTGQSAPPSPHRSNVLERQNRQNTARRELESQARHNRTSASGRSSMRGVNVQRGRSGFSETGRRNR